MRVFAAFTLALWACLLTVPTAHGAEFLSGETVTITKDETWEGDLYVMAQSVTIEGLVEGDLVVYAQALDLRGTVEGSLIAACQQARIAGRCGRSSRIAAHAIQLTPQARLAADLVAAAYSLEIEEGAVVNGDLVYAGYQALLHGDVREDVWGAMARAALHGTIGQELSISTGGNQPNAAPRSLNRWMPSPLFPLPPVEPGLTIHPGAEVKGKMTYHSPNEAVIDSEAKVTGPIEWLEPQREPLAIQDEKTRFFVEQLKRYATLLVLGLLMVLVCPTTTGGTVDEIVERPVLSFLLGIVAVPISLVMVGVIGALIGILPLALGLLTMDGLAAASSAVAAFTLVLYVGSWVYYLLVGAAAVISITLGRIVFSDYPIVSRGRLSLALMFGLIVYVVLTCVPYLRVGVAVTAVLFAFGGLLLWILHGAFRNRPERTV